MGSRVVQLEPRVLPFAEAVAAFRGARYDDCLAALQSRDAFEAQALWIRALTRSGRVEAALEECRRWTGAELPTGELAEVNLLEMAALLRLGRFDDADDLVPVARVGAYSSCSPALEADFEATEGLLRYYQRDFPAAGAALDRALGVGPSAQPWLQPRTEYFLSLGLVRARACDFRGMLVKTKEGLRAQLHWAAMALHELDADPREDEWVSAWILSNFALVAVEIGEPSMADELSQRVSTARWAASTQLQRFHTTRSLGWLRALAGDHLGAFREFRGATELAPSRAWKLHSILDRAFLARELGKNVLAEEELSDAIEQAEQLDLSAAGDPMAPFSALINLAQLAAARNPVEGRSMLERYRAARAKCAPIVLDGVDRGWQARELMAEASVVRAEGRTQLAADLFVNAFDAFDRLGSHWRAAQAALALAEMGGEPFFAAYAAREAKRRPQSWLARRFAALPRES